MALKRPTMILLAVLAGLAGAAWFHAPLVTGHQQLLHGDLGDGRLCLLFLEHTFRSLVTGEIQSYWDAPWNFYPFKSVLAMSEVMTGGSLPYVLSRLAGLGELSAYQVWTIVTSLGNYLSFVLLARFAGAAFAPALVGGWLFSFSMARGTFLIHPQLLLQYPSLLGIWCGLHYLEAPPGRPRILWLTGAALLVSMQLWGSFYLGWFTGLAILILIAWLAVRRFGVLRERLSTDRRALAVAGLAFVATVGPLAYQYLRMKSLVGGTGFGGVLEMTPPWQAYLAPHPHSVWYRWLTQYVRLPESYFHYELYLFPGFVTLLSPLVFGFVALRRSQIEYFVERPEMRRYLMYAVGFAFLITALAMRFEGRSLWWLIYKTVPGASATRGVSRIVLLTLLPIGLAYALGMTHVLRRYSRRVAIPVFLAVSIIGMFEGGANWQYVFSKKTQRERLARMVGLVEAARAKQDCEVFHYASANSQADLNIDAMWASMETGVPTTNGYSGSLPPHYKELGLYLASTTTLEGVQAWLSANGKSVPAERICMLTDPQP